MFSLCLFGLVCSVLAVVQADDIGLGFCGLQRNFGTFMFCLVDLLGCAAVFVRYVTSTFWRLVQFGMAWRVFNCLGICETVLLRSFYVFC